MAYINGKEILFSPKVDITIEDGAFVPSGTLNITENGAHDVSQYAIASVSVEGFVPSGTLNITANGTHNVSQYENVKVEVGDVTDTYVGTIDGTITKLEKKDLSVAEIRKYAFQYCSFLTSVDIPSSVITIGDYAFGSCSELTSVEMTNSVTSIGNGIFSGCSNLASVVLSSAITKIPQNAFSSCKMLKTIYIPSVTSIGSNAFYNCTSLEIADFSKNTSVPTIPTGIFKNTPDNLQIRVPTALYDEWKNATNWAEYASQIFAV